jgi:uncharacterized damage-inducible protein DinB
MPDPLDRVFLKFSADKLRQFASRIEVCLDKLNDDQIWLRGSENANAVGNLVLHLCGNLRQWIGTGVAGKPDVRVRDREFAARGDIAATDLKERLRTTVEDTAAIIQSLTAERLAETTRVQSYDITVFEAVYHVVEHFAQHTGQIIFATKALTGEDLGFYRHLTKPAHAEQVP